MWTGLQNLWVSWSFVKCNHDAEISVIFWSSTWKHYPSAAPYQILEWRFKMKNHSNRRLLWEEEMIKHLYLFILVFAVRPPEMVEGLTMGFGKTMSLAQDHDRVSGRAFDFNIFPSSGDYFEEPYVRHHQLQHSYLQPRHHFHQHQSHNPHLLEIDLKFAKKKPIPGVRHLFCSGYYCAFEYSSWKLYLPAISLRSDEPDREHFIIIMIIISLLSPNSIYLLNCSIMIMHDLSFQSHFPEWLSFNDLTVLWIN